MKRKRTHIGKMRSLYACNQQHIRAAFEWDDESYNNAWLDLGLAFLDKNYPKKNAIFVRESQRISRDRRYWNWVQLEYKRWEDEMLKEYEKRSPDLSEKSYQRLLNILLHSVFLKSSFSNNYIYNIKIK